MKSRVIRILNGINGNLMRLIPIISDIRLYQ